MPVLDPTYLRQQQEFLFFNAHQNVLETKGNALNYVLYRKKHYSLQNALCFVILERKLYAVLEADPEPDPEGNKAFKKVGMVFRNRRNESDLSDTPEENTETAYPVYKRKFGGYYYVSTPDKPQVWYPMLLVRSGIMEK